LVVIDEKGVPWGEDYTLVAAADYILSHQPGGKVVANLSSSSALKTITERHGGAYSETPVGEMHVVARMKEIKALIGGEGNGGVIYPALHYGRDALAGIALILSHLAKSGKTASQLRASYPTYVMVKTKFPFDRKLDFQSLTHVLQAHFPGALVNLAEGIKMSLPDGWFHIRASNTEPIIRLHVEGFCQKAAHDIAEKATMILKKMLLA
jgi:phosphomannomutase